MPKDIDMVVNDIQVMNSLVDTTSNLEGWFGFETWSVETW